jgi:hypothetical protein
MRTPLSRYIRKADAVHTTRQSQPERSLALVHHMALRFINDKASEIILRSDWLCFFAFICGYLEFC